ncbi:MAG: GNAT family N-acetyltransferase [Halobellus sp.]|uniref:GNAT family N-acetyltransferase n=1 Tax=Halobellus sp. TaxID=1979212 RepID=UPI0035D4825E
MEFAVLGWPPTGPTLRLDFRRFAYAGKFVMSNTGKAVVRNDGEYGTDESLETPTEVDADEFEDDIVAALAFNEDRTDGDTLWYRYITVRADARGEGLGPRLATFLAPKAAQRGYERLRIAVNNPFAYEAMYKAGFGWTGRESGVAELVLGRPAEPTEAATRDRSKERYRDGLRLYRERNLGEPEESFLAARTDADTPERTGPHRPSDPDD